MSRPLNGTNGDTNGYYSQGSINRYNEERQDGDLTEAPRELRGGGYGGFIHDNLLAPEGREQSRERNALDQNDSRGARNASGARQIEGEWNCRGHYSYLMKLGFVRRGQKLPSPCTWIL